MKLHSTINLITNSSTELFVIPKDRIKLSVEEYKDILSQMWELWKTTKLKTDPEAINHSFGFYNLTLESTIDDIMTIYVEDSDYTYYCPSYNRGEKPQIYEAWQAGDITIRGTDDNIIPYELFEMIESMFYARSYHLG